MASLTWHAARPLTNTDTYFHLRFGHEFLDGGWTLRNPGSVSSFGTNDWVPTQWLPQVVMAQLEDWFGLAGVAWFQGLLHLALAVTFWVIARRCATPLASAAIVATALMASSLGLSMRPQVISYLLVAVTTAAWLRTREDGRARWWLVPVTWVWAMCHGMWPVGIVIGVVALVGHRRGPRRSAPPAARAWPPSRWRVAVAAALTPVGPRLYPAVLARQRPRAVLRRVAAAGLHRRRRRRPAAPDRCRGGPHGPPGHRSPLDRDRSVGLAVGWALYSTRTVAVAAAMLVPIAAQVLLRVAAAAPRRPAAARPGPCSPWPPPSSPCWPSLVPRTADEPPDEPSWASAVDDLPAGTVVLNDWGQGGWMIWRWPELDFVMNGYGDIFTDDGAGP